MEHLLGYRDLLFFCSLMRPSGKAATVVAEPRTLCKLDTTVVTVACVDVPAAARLALSEPIPDTRGLGGRWHDTE
jgi:hypothetical protein